MTAQKYVRPHREYHFRDGPAGGEHTGSAALWRRKKRDERNDAGRRD